MATIKDIAARLGVSISTVSKGLNGASDISEELRQTVLDTAVEMGYSTKRSRKVENRKLALFIENMNYESIDEFGYCLLYTSPVRMKRSLSSRTIPDDHPLPNNL